MELQGPPLSFRDVDDGMLPASGGKIACGCRSSRHIERAERGHRVTVQHSRVFHTACPDFPANG